MTPSRKRHVAVRASDYGQILFDGGGRALYAFTRDPRGRSVCAGPCADSWPPYLLRSSLRAGEGIEASLLDTMQRLGVLPRDVVDAADGWLAAE